MTRSLVVSRVFLWSVLLLLPISVSAQQLDIHYINVNWGGSVLVKGPNGTTVLLEAGNTGKGTGRVLPYLQSIGIVPANGLDYTFAGHQHCDHIGGLDEVIQAGYNVHIKTTTTGHQQHQPASLAGTRRRLQRRLARRWRFRWAP